MIWGFGEPVGTLIRELEHTKLLSKSKKKKNVGKYEFCKLQFGNLTFGKFWNLGILELQNFDFLNLGMLEL